MCAICGIVTYSRNPVNPLRILQMRDSMIHRGPDAEGQFVDSTQRVFLGHRRLRIIDLSSAANQPMSNPQKSIQIVFNGEIYNYLELRKELEHVGFTFQTHSDTEVIIQAYVAWGVTCVEKFNGMFAFALYDVPQGQLFLARDRLGIKPLYYTFSDEEFAFASEMRALLAISPRLRMPNLNAIYDFLTLMRFDHNETTFFSKIFQLNPGHFLLLNTNAPAQLKPQRYWELSAADAHQRYDYERPVETFATLLSDAIRLQVRSDVTVGSFLSGGLDSSGIVAIASRMTSRSMRTFSAVYDDEGYNEQQYMNEAIKAFNVDPFTTYPTARKLKSDLRLFVRAQEIPLAGPGPFSEWCVSEIARGNVTVLLNGQGPDEMLGGYHYSFGSYMHSLLRHAFSTSPVLGLREALNAARMLSDLTGKRRTHYLLDSLIYGSLEQNAIRWLKRKVRETWMEQSLKKHSRTVPLQARNQVSSGGGKCEFQAYLRESLTGGGLQSLLHYADRNSMAFSLEARVPYLDHRLVEFSAALPLQLLLNPPYTKYILRLALKGQIPEKIRLRTTKLGFSTPIAKWFREDPSILREELTESSIRARGLLNPRAVSRMIATHVAGESDNSWDLWRILTLELWFQEFIDQN